MSAQETWLTQEAYDRLQAELAERSGPIREEIKDRIAQARKEGALRENGGYHAAREQQGQEEGAAACCVATCPASTCRAELTSATV